MKKLIFLGFILVSCSRPQETIKENDDYVLVEFAAKLEEEQGTFQKMHKSPTAP